MKKITRRSFLAAAGVSAAALALTACGGSSNSAASTSTAASSTAASAAGDATAAANDPKVTLVYAEVNPLDTIVGQTGSHFKEKVEELSGGSVVVDVQASGVLGSENDVLDAILGGSTSIDISRISAFALTSYGCNKSKLLSIPFTFNNRAHFWNFANSDLAPEFLNEPQELGLPVRGLFYGEEGFRHFFTVKPVAAIGDLKATESAPLTISTEGNRRRVEAKLPAGMGVLPAAVLLRAVRAFALDAVIAVTREEKTEKKEGVTDAEAVEAAAARMTESLATALYASGSKDVAEAARGALKVWEGTAAAERLPMKAALRVLRWAVEDVR